jgi:hypothetical protein
MALVLYIPMIIQQLRFFLRKFNSSHDRSLTPTPKAGGMTRHQAH